MKSTFTLALLFVGLHFSVAQRCGTMILDEQFRQEFSDYAQKRAFIETFTQLQYDSNSSERGGSNVITIPVVFHVVHRTAQENISDAQLQSQITVLNEDFRKLNANFASSTPAVFQGVSADFELEFCLATRDPNGNATNGITRTSTTVNGFNVNDNDRVKFTSQGGKDGWPSNKYLNIWVCNFSTNLLGYATFPGGPANRDGVVLLYTSVGRPPANPFNNPYNRGRTGTHEVGHWLNLFHIWGDDDGACSGSDQVADTPNQADENFGCPTHPSPSCNNGGDMFMNYMDYMDDACASLFTNGQKTRSRALFNPGGFRNALLTSDGCGNIVTPPTGDPCVDTLRFPLPGDYVIYFDEDQGFIAGTNVYNDRAKADRFSPVAPHTLVKGGLFRFSYADAGSVPNHQVTFRLYNSNGTGGLPNTVLATATLPISQIISDVNNNQYTTVTFPTPVAVTGDFYLGFEVAPTSGVILALYTNEDGQSIPNTAYEQFENQQWVAYTANGSWQISISHAISAIMEVPPANANFTINTPTICQGQSVAYTASTPSSAGTFAWQFPGGNPSTSTQASPTVSYQNSGTFSATLTVTGACASQPISNTQANLVTVNSLPPIPSITEQGTLLVSSAASGNQWFLNNNPIAGATGNTFQPTQNGSYTVRVTIAGCISTSSPVTVTITNLIGRLNEMIIFYPNPAADEVFIKSNSFISEGMDISIYTTNGQLVMQENIKFNANNQAVLSTQKLINGLYFVEIRKGEQIGIQRLSIIR